VRLLHYHFLTDARFFLGIKRKTGLPAIVSAYGYDVSSFPAAWKGIGLRYIRPVFDRIDCVLAMTEDMKRDLIALGCPEGRIRVHYHGINTRRFQYLERNYQDDGLPTVLSCGRFVPKKGQARLLEALRRIDRRGRRFRLVLVGDGPLRRNLEQVVSSYGWEHCVTFAGHLPHIGPELVSQYQKANIFALPSTTAHGEKEGIPGTLVEAMASGLPIVSTQHAGIPAVIQPDLHGLLVPEGDVEALAEALDRLLTDPDLRARLGRSAAERAVTEFDVTKRTAALELIYDEFVRSAPLR
jgi:colanic acid/amylovoran biosynthesis glycosyltransferase